MGFEDRDYTRTGDYTGTLAGWGLDYISPVVKWLIIVNVVVFLLQAFVTRPMTQADRQLQIERLPKIQRDMIKRAQEAAKKAKLDQPKRDEDAVGPDELDELYGQTQRISIVQEWLELEPRLVVFRGQVWRLLTSAFCHEWSGVWHILFNMFGLYLCGVTLESMYGPREFLLFYLTAAVISALAYVALALYTDNAAPAIGASGAVMAVLMLYAIHYPRNTFRIFWFIPIEVRWLVVLYVIFDLHPLLLQLSGNQIYTGIAHAAHLGGLAFGFVYWKLGLQLERYRDLLPKFGAPSRGPRRARTAAARRSPERQLDDEVDAILQKIHDSGEAALTEQERRKLEQASQRYKRKLN